MNVKLLFVLFCIINVICIEQSVGQNTKMYYGASVSADWNSYLFVQDAGALEYRGSSGFSVGLIGRRTISNRFSCDLQINYASKSYEEAYDLTQYRAITDADLIPLKTDKISSRYQHHFLDLPISINYAWVKSNHLEFYSSLGLVGSVLLGYRYEGNIHELDYLGIDHVNEYIADGSYKSFLASSKIGMGLFIKASKIGITIEPQIRVFLNRVHQNKFTENPIHFGIQFSILKM